MFEIERKGGPLGITENLGEVSKHSQSERGHGVKELEGIISGEDIKGPEGIKSSIPTSEAKHKATKDAQINPEEGLC